MDQKLGYSTRRVFGGTGVHPSRTQWQNFPPPLAHTLLVEPDGADKEGSIINCTREGTVELASALRGCIYLVAGTELFQHEDRQTPVSAKVNKGATVMKTGTYINFHKALVIPVVLGLMWHYRNWSTDAFVYLSIHGTYSLLWLIKQVTYPDRRFDQTQPIWIGVLFVFLPLAAYYLAPFLLISRHVALPPFLFAIVLTIYTFGIFLHYVSDGQKYYTLKLKKGIITEGLFARTRNPNYLGEILIYVAFALMSLHWLPFLVLASWVFGFFLRNMLMKDKSLSRYPEFESYRRRSGLLIPRLLPPKAMPVKTREVDAR